MEGETAGAAPTEASSRLQEADSLALRAVRGAQKDAAAALRDAEASANIVCSELGQRHSKAALSYNLLGDISCAAGRDKDAVQYFKAALSVLLNCVACDPLPVCPVKPIQCPRHIEILEGEEAPALVASSATTFLSFGSPLAATRATERCSCKHHVLFSPQQHTACPLFPDPPPEQRRLTASFDGQEQNPLPPLWFADRELYCEECRTSVCVDCLAALGGAYSDNEIIDLLQYKIGAVLLSLAGGEVTDGWAAEHTSTLLESQEYLSAALAARMRRHCGASCEDVIEPLSALAALQYRRGDATAARQLAEAAIRLRARLPLSAPNSDQFLESCERRNATELRAVGAFQ
eukprot:TRINITY_DN29037_c0_g1_i1.p2 TRINITY_DN29037_c0_g1~~TRINITY_DN29037_c0_g1_i1.p2  ORF type:complete len:348 (+),score=104.58 TRINITY_DN29037_c0_g1_i1:43-1086(+)